MRLSSGHLHVTWSQSSDEAGDLRFLTSPSVVTINRLHGTELPAYLTNTFLVFLLPRTPCALQCFYRRFTYQSSSSFSSSKPFCHSSVGNKDDLSNSTRVPGACYLSLELIKIVVSIVCVAFILCLSFQHLSIVLQASQI